MELRDRPYQVVEELERRVSMASKTFQDWKIGWSLATYQLALVDHRSDDPLRTTDAAVEVIPAQLWFTGTRSFAHCSSQCSEALYGLSEGPHFGDPALVNRCFCQGYEIPMV